MNYRKPLTVYKASAGSGKTFTLAVEYIKLLIANPQSYRSILAVTFTNKATEEMKTRILSQLYGISRRLPDSQAYLDIVTSSLGKSEDYVCRQAETALNLLLHNYHFFRVETIDSFFQKVLRNLARELGLTANLRVELNDSEIEQQAVDEIIDSLNEKDEVLGWLMAYIRDNIDEDRNWNVIRQIKKFGENIFKDYYKDNSNGLKVIHRKGFFADFRRQLQQQADFAREKMEGFANRFYEDLERYGLAIDDLANKKSGAGAYFKKLKEGQMDSGIVGKRILACIDNPELWASKTGEKRELIIERGRDLWSPLAQEAESLRPMMYKQYQSAVVTMKHLNQLRLLEKIEEKVRELNQDSNRYLLSHTPDLLNSLINESDTPFVYEKFGSQLEHIMIDEFQDTSTIQWRNFKILLQESMSHHTSNLLVGDVKQSIYRWRSGDWRLLNNIQSQFADSADMVDIRNLAVNYRSAARVVSFNNVFFELAVADEYTAFQEQDAVDAGQLLKAYADVRQQVPEGKPDKGYVSIRLFSKDKTQKKMEVELISVLREMIDNRHVAPKDIAILVRSNKHLPVLAELIMAEMPHVQLVSDEAFRLDASSAVNMIVQAMHLLVHPEDILARATLAVVYQQEILQVDVPHASFLVDHKNYDVFLPEEYVGNFYSLLSMPLYELAQQLYSIFKLERLQGQGAYVCSFYDVLNEYLNDQSTDIGTFLHDWQDSLCGKSIQSDVVEGIRLLSIHKSKGLEFKHVIIPYCDWKFDVSGEMIWCKPDEEPFSQLPVIPISYSKSQLVGTIYERDYWEEYLQKTVDNLNLLYVAFTRAGNSLTVLGESRSAGYRSHTIRNVMEEVTCLLPEATFELIEDGENKLWILEYGEFEEETDEKKRAAKDVSENVFMLPSQEKTMYIESFEANTDFIQSNQSSKFIYGEEADDKQQEYMKRGSLLHYILSQIHYIDELDSVVARMEEEGLLSDGSISGEYVRSFLFERLQDGRRADWFSREWEVFNECNILSPIDGSSKIVEHRPDRVIYNGERMMVIDFKFGRRRNEHAKQVSTYLQLLSSMGYTDIVGYLWYVYTDEVDEVNLE